LTILEVTTFNTPSSGERMGKFDSLLVETIDEVLRAVLGDRSAQEIYEYLARRSCRRDEIPLKLEIFSTELRNVLYDSRSSPPSGIISVIGRAAIVERTVVRILCRKIGMGFTETGPVNLPSFISNLRGLYALKEGDLNGSART